MFTHKPIWNVLSDWSNRDDGEELKATLDHNLSLLAAVDAESPAKAKELRSRLQRADARDYRSAGLELLLTDAFRSHQCLIEWEPAIPQTLRTVEFRAHMDEHTCLVEARLSGPERAISDQWAISMPLAERVDSLDLLYVLVFNWLGTPPAVHSLEDIWLQLEPPLKDLGDAPSGHRTSIEVRAHGQRYTLQIEVVGTVDGEGTKDGGVVPSTGGLKLDPVGKLRTDLLTKVNRYGAPLLSISESGTDRDPRRLLL